MLSCFLAVEEEKSTPNTRKCQVTAPCTRSCARQSLKYKSTDPSPENDTQTCCDTNRPCPHAFSVVEEAVNSKCTKRATYCAVYSRLRPTTSRLINLPIHPESTPKAYRNTIGSSFHSFSMVEEAVNSKCTKMRLIVPPLLTVPTVLQNKETLELINRKQKKMVASSLPFALNAYKLASENCFL